MKIPKVNVLILLLLYILFANFTYGQNFNEISRDKSKVVILLISRVDYDDLRDMSNVSELIDKGYIGLMNTRASGRYSEIKSYATLGWGTRAEALEDTLVFDSINDETKDIYYRRVGRALESHEGIINIAINKLIQQNIKAEFKAVPGTMGELLRKNGYKTAVIGNSDTDVITSRPVGFIAMDSRGYIDYGKVNDDILMEDANSPFGIRTDYDALLSEFQIHHQKSNLTVIDTGDMSRLEAYRVNLNSDTYKNHKSAIMNNINDFIGDLLEKIDFAETRLIVVTPYPSEASYEAGDRLTPVIIYDGRDTTGGVLTSDTTRRYGIVGNIDIAPTILDYFNITATNTTGRKIVAVPMDNQLSFIQELNERTVNTSVIRYRILYTFAVFEMLASVLALLSIVYRKKIPKGFSSFSAGLLLSTIVVPLVLLILSVFGVGSIFKTYLMVALITIILTLIIYFIFKKDPIKAIMFTSLLLVISLLLDIATGQNLIQNSILGYDPIIGARYYGIGNEFVGILLGSSLIGITALQEKYRKKPLILMLLFSILVLFIGYPKLGANVGGTITALFAFLFTYSMLAAKKMNYKRWSIILAIVTCAILSLAFIDFFLLEKKSHLAGAIQQIVTGGPVVIYQIIIRKVTMNIRVMSVTVWSRVLLIALGILGVLFYRPRGLLKSLSEKYPSLLAGWSGIIVACIVGFAVNDSGVVMAATCIIFLTTSILYLLLTDAGMEGRR